MVDKLLSTLITDVQSELYQVAGVAVQVYSQDNIARKITNAFDLLYGEKLWKRFRSFVTLTLDGTTGYTTVPISDTFSSTDDIFAVFREGSDRKLTMMSGERNPSEYTGNSPQQYVYGGTTDLIKIIPSGSTGNITIVGQVYPGPFALDSIVPFDSLALTYLAAWQYSVDDGAMGGSQQKFKALFDARIKALKSNQEDEPLALNGYSAQIPDRWAEV